MRSRRFSRNQLHAHFLNAGRWSIVALLEHLDGDHQQEPTIERTRSGEISRLTPSSARWISS